MMTIKTKDDSPAIESTEKPYSLLAYEVLFAQRFSPVCFVFFFFFSLLLHRRPYLDDGRLLTNRSREAKWKSTEAFRFPCCGDKWTMLNTCYNIIGASSASAIVAFTIVADNNVTHIELMCAPRSCQPDWSPMISPSAPKGKKEWTRTSTAPLQKANMSLFCVIIIITAVGVHLSVSNQHDNKTRDGEGEGEESTRHLAVWRQLRHYFSNDY